MKSLRIKVSTHSRLKAAGLYGEQHPISTIGFNTQPPEGGWPDRISAPLQKLVSTHSRLKAAGKALRQLWQILRVSTHSRLKAAGISERVFRGMFACFNTQPPEGGWFQHKKL